MCVAMVRDSVRYIPVRLSYTTLRCETSYRNKRKENKNYKDGGARLQNGDRGKTAISERQNYLT